MPPPGWMNPIAVPAGQTQAQVDPLTLLPSRSDLIQARLNLQ